MFIKRTLSEDLLKASKQFPIIGIMGPRQSGKTTLAHTLFAHYTYISMEDLDVQRNAQEDPRKFFATYTQSAGLIIDEIQESPDLFSYLQGIVDQNHRPGFFIITGSHNFLLYEKITQTLAGRIALFTLLPLTIAELHNANLLANNPETVIQSGLYPRPFIHTIDSEFWFSQYIRTYVERDVRHVLNISNLTAFQKFLTLCAARTAQILNYASIARDCDISPNTAKAWLSILEASYIIVLLQPYYKNFSKRVIKAPKLYFYDTGLVCALLGITRAQDLYTHPLRGALFETLMISELHKNYFNRGKFPRIYYWRDVQGHEIDCIIEKSYDQIIPIEIKAGMTIYDNFFKELVEWQTVTNQENLPAYIIYAGTENQHRKQATIISWNKVNDLIF